MRYYLKDDVLIASKKRIRYLFDNFDNVIVSFSGGKDSVVVLELAIEIAREKDRLPIDVWFVDQETEYQATIDIVEKTMNRPEVNPKWLQIPFQLLNSTNNENLNVWAEGAKWLRPKSPISIHENTYGTIHFYEIFNAFIKKEYSSSVANLGGVRTEESPTRFLGLTNARTWRHITWGKVVDAKKDKYTFYPIYDWSYTDVWKSIHDFKWDYCKIYDSQYQYGVPIPNMRVSSLIHETAINAFNFLQEVEPDSWNRLVERVEGGNTQAQIGKLSCPKDLPTMFQSWQQYRDYLNIHLTKEEKIYNSFVRLFERNDEKYKDHPLYFKICVEMIIIGDYTFIKFTNFEKSVSWAEHKDEK